MGGWWPLNLAAGLRQALGSPGAHAIRQLLAVTLAPGESGAVFTRADAEPCLLAAFPADEPFRRRSVHRLASEVFEAPGCPGRAAPPAWATAIEADGEVHAVLVLLAADGGEVSDESRERAGVLAPALGLVAELAAVRSRARDAEAHVAHARQERLQLTAHLARAERQARVGRLAGSLAHEIRNPLTVIGTTVQYLRDRLPPEHEHRVLLDAADRKVREMDESLETVLSLTRPLDLRPQAVDVGRLVADVARFLEGQAGRQGVVIALEAEAGPIPAMLDRGLVERALLNLGLNALDAMPGGGRLTFAARTASEGGTVLLSVADTGLGAALAEPGTAFEVAYASKRRGAGLGLAVTRRIVEEHGGAIEATSEAGRGTTILVTLPTAGDPRPETARG
jgi:signal transduction histidine kinase